MTLRIELRKMVKASVPPSGSLHSIQRGIGRPHTIVNSPARLRPFCHSSVSRARVPPLLYQTFAQNARSNNPIWRNSRFKYGSGIVLVGGTLYYASHLETVEITGRRRFMNVSASAEAAASKESYDQIMQQFSGQVLPESHPHTKFVKKVAGPLIRASGLKDLQWEVQVIQSEQANAFVIPGGKIFVFSGILPIAQNEDGLAAVLGHEIGHQCARHIAEKMSFNPILQVVQLGVFYGLASLNLPPDLAFGLGNGITSLVLDNPYSRMHETEADHIGLLLMAMACFDPREAVHMWERMSKAGGTGVPQFLSTHPTNENRIAKIQGWMQEALDQQQKSDCQQRLGGLMGQFRDKQVHAKW